jgi:uncharacterized protein (DUF488 family)
MIIWTIGHSTRSAAEFTAILRAHGIERLIDIRTVPRSRRNPQFNRDELPETLAAAGIAYLHMAGLGGLRHPRKDSPNTAWRNDSFRGYADYMQTEEFERSLTELIRLAERQRVAIMCAEAVPWRCHRSMVADALAARGIDVRHIFSETTEKPHSITPFAKVENNHVTYPGLPLPTPG